MTFIHFMCLCFTFVALGLLFERTLTALGRVLVVVAWLAVIAVTLALSAHGQATTQDGVNKIQRLAAAGVDPEWQLHGTQTAMAGAEISTPTPASVPTLDPSRIRCTTFAVSSPPIICCAMWTGNKWGQGTWQPLGCTR